MKPSTLTDRYLSSLGSGVAGKATGASTIRSLDLFNDPLFPRQALDLPSAQADQVQQSRPSPKKYKEDYTFHNALHSGEKKKAHEMSHAPCCIRYLTPICNRHYQA